MLINQSGTDRQPGLFSSFLFSGIIPVLVAAFAYPLGNRKMMQLTKGRLDVYQRILGMLICSMPFWLLLSGYELFVKQNIPGNSQYLQTFIVAISSGVIATALFFFATDKVSIDENSLAAVEATQSTEVVFALMGEVWLLRSPFPDTFAIIGMTLVILGMVLHSLKSLNASRD
jgi:drug/metabolite transporter (DMT)-like permease